MSGAGGDEARAVAFLNDAKLAPEEKQKSLALANVHELLIKKRPDLAARFLQPIVELTADPSAAVRQFVPTFFEAMLQNRADLLNQNMLEALVRLVSDKNSAVAKKAIGCCTYLFPGALKTVAGSPLAKAQTMNKALDNIREAIFRLLAPNQASPPPVATQVQCLKFVEALVILYANAAANGLSSALLLPANLQQQAGAFLELLVNHLSSPLQPPVQSALLATLGAVAVAIPALIDKCMKPLVMFAESEEVPKTARKAAQLALLRLLRAGLVQDPDRVEELEDAVTVSGGAKQLDKLRRMRENKRDGTVSYDWDEGPGAGGDMGGGPEVSQQPVEEAQPEIYVPPDLTLLDVRILYDVDVLVRELTPEQLAELVIENMANMAAVGAKPGDEAFMELAAVARDPRLNEERKQRKIAPRLPILGMCEGLPVPQLSREQLQAMWRGCVSRIVNSEDAVLLKGARAVQLRCALLARLVSGQDGGPTQEEACRSTLMHATEDLMRRWRIVYYWMMEEWRLSGYMEDDEADVVKQESKILPPGVSVEPMDLSGDSDNEASNVHSKVVAGETSSSSNYAAILNYVLDATLPTVDVVLVALRRLLLAVPFIPHSSFEKICALAGDPEKHASGLSLLSSIARALPVYRERCLLAVMDQTVAEEQSVRRAALQEAVSLYLDAECRAIVEEFAREKFEEAVHSESLNRDFKAEDMMAADIAPLVVGVDGEGPLAQERRALLIEMRRLEAEKTAAQMRTAQAMEVVRLAGTFFALCGENLLLLGPIANAYATTGMLVKREMHELVKISLSNAMGEPPTEPSLLVDALELMDLNAARPLVLFVLHQVAAAVKTPSERFVAYCKSHYATLRDAALLLPVVKELKAREILAEVPRFMMLEKNAMVDFIARTLATQNFIDKPAELMLRFCSTTTAECGCDERKLLLQQNEAIALCFNHPRYTQDVMATVLRKLSEQSVIHPLFMKMAMMTASKYSELLAWLLNSVLPRLVTARAWNNPVLWKGFQKFCVSTVAQGSCALLLRLPIEVFTQFLDDEPTVAPALKKYIKDHPKSANTAIKRVLRGKN